MALKNGLEVIDESVSALSANERKLANLSRIRRQPTQLGMKGACAAEGPVIRPQ